MSGVAEPKENYVTGWIKVYRSILTHWLWDKKPYNKIQAFLWILIKANHKPNKLMIGEELVECKRGEFITSQLKLSEEFGWNRERIRTFLNTLEKDHVIHQQTTNKYTKLTVCKYDTYQAHAPTEDQQTTNRPPTNQQQVDTNNNDKERKEWKEGDWFLIRGAIPPSIEDVRDYCLFRQNSVNAKKWLDHYESKGWMIGKNRMKDWQAAVRTWEDDEPKKTKTVELAGSYSQNPRTDL